MLRDGRQRLRQRVVGHGLEGHVAETREVDVVVDDALVAGLVEAARVAVGALHRDLVEGGEHLGAVDLAGRVTAATRTFVKSKAYIANSGGWMTVSPFAVLTPTFCTPKRSR